MKGLFFNAQPTSDIITHPSGYDREYDSDDFNRYMGVFFGNGVFVRQDADACKIMASGLALAVTPGIALVDGSQCHFEPGDGLTLPGDGMYSIMCRRNNAAEVRGFELVAVKEEGAYPVPVRDGDIFDLCLARVQVTDGAATVVDTREDRDLCGFAALTGQPPYYPPDEANLPYILWLYVLGLPMTPEQVEAVEGNPSLMEIFEQSRIVQETQRATKEEAEAGTDNRKIVTPFGARAAIESQEQWIKDRIGRRGMVVAGATIPQTNDDRVIALPGVTSSMYNEEGHIAAIGDCIAYGKGTGSATAYTGEFFIYNLREGRLVKTHTVSSVRYTMWVGVSMNNTFLFTSNRGTWEYDVDGNLLDSWTGNISAPDLYNQQVIPIDAHRVLTKLYTSGNSSYAFTLLVNGVARSTSIAGVKPQSYHVSYQISGDHITLIYRNTGGLFVLGKLTLGTVANSGGVSVYQECVLWPSAIGDTERSMYCLFDGAFAYVWGSYNTSATAFIRKINLATMVIEQSVTTPILYHFYFGNIVKSYFSDSEYLWLGAESDGSQSVPRYLYKVRKLDMTVISVVTSLAGIPVESLLAAGMLPIQISTDNGASVNANGFPVIPSKKIVIGSQMVNYETLTIVEPIVPSRCSLYIAPFMYALSATSAWGLFDSSARKIQSMTLAPSEYPWGEE